MFFSILFKSLRLAIKAVPTSIVGYVVEQLTGYYLMGSVSDTGFLVLSFLAVLGVWASWPACRRPVHCERCNGEHPCEVPRWHVGSCEHDICDDPPRRRREARGELPDDIKAALDPLPQGA